MKLILVKHLCLIIYFLAQTCASDVEDIVDISPFATVFETTSLPVDENGNFNSRLMASVGNGHVSTTMYSDTVYMNGLYNGFKGDSHRARIPSKSNIRVTTNTTQIRNHTFALDVEKGVFYDRFETSNFTVEIRKFAHRFYHKVIITQIHVKPLGLEGELELSILTDSGVPSSDINLAEESVYDSFVPSVYQCGTTNQVEDPIYQETFSTVCIISTVIPASIRATNESTFTYFASYDKDLARASSDFDAVAKAVKAGNHEIVLNSHVDAWKAVWNDGRIEIEGNIQLAKAVYGSLYYILSSLPVTTRTNSRVGQFYGLSPGGLAFGSLSNDYQGHSFWDTETWMYPTILYFYPKAAKEILNYRMHVIKAARDRANDTGYKGTRFPWESAYTGREVTPDCCPETRDLQVHITGDIAFAIRQYIASTMDENWLKQIQGNYLTNGCGLIREIAEFWISRAAFNTSTGHYDIKGVMPPDEDNYYVDNSIYTNVIAGYSIFFAKFAECLCGESMSSIPENWIEAAKALKFPYDSELDFHPEFDGYNLGTSIKQADVVLLGFPLMYNMSYSTRRNDLLIYENVTRPTGPAMTWAMHTIGMLELDNIERAESLFNRSYQPYMKQPFKVWTESLPPVLGAMNFITGMGGFLQAVVSGHGGLRLHPDRLEFMKARVPPGSSGLNLIGVKYLENIFNLHVQENQLRINITYVSQKYPLTANFKNGTTIPFVNNEAVIFMEDGPVTIHLYTEILTTCQLPIDEIGGTVPG